MENSVVVPLLVTELSVVPEVNKNNYAVTKNQQVLSLKKITVRRLLERAEKFFKNLLLASYFSNVLFFVPVQY